MHRLSTIFSTSCPLKDQNFCCQKETADYALSCLKQFLLKKKIDLQLDFLKNEDMHFRKKAKLAVRGKRGDPCIGIFKEGTHDCVDMEECLAHAQEIKEAIKAIKSGIVKFDILPYNEKSNLGNLRYFQVIVDQKNKLHLTLVLCKKLVKEKELINFLESNLSVSSIYLNYQNKSTNTIFGDTWEKVFGDEMIEYEVMGKTIFFHPGSFMQNNIPFFENILKDLKNELGTFSKGLDLYSGAGMIGLCFEDHFNTLHFAETNPLSKVSFDFRFKKIPYTKGEYFNLDAKKVLFDHLDADCIFLDPPRKGLEKSLKPILANLKEGAKLVYISCGYLSLIRDLDELFQVGFKLEFIKAYDCFRGSKEVEVLCILEKKSG